MPRTTVAQAVVTWLANQHVERDGHRQRFFEGVFGIFGHGIVAGMGEALESRPGHACATTRRATSRPWSTRPRPSPSSSRRLRTFACTTSIGPGATNLVTGAANATVNRLPVLLLPGDRFATRRVKPVLQQLERPEAGDLSVNDALRPVSRYFDRIERPEHAHRRAAGGHARADLAGRDRRRDAGPAPGRPGRGVGLGRTSCSSAAHLGRRRDRGRTRALLARAAERIAGLAAADDRGRRWRHLQRRRARRWTPSRRRFGIPVAETQAGKGALPWDHPCQLGALGSTGGTAANAVARDADLVIAIGTRLSDFPTMSWSAWQDPEVALRGHQRGRAGRRQGGRRCRSSATPASRLEELGEALEARGWRGRRRPSGWRSSSGCAATWNAEVDRVRHLVGREHVSQPEASASSTRRPARTASSSAPRAACPATCTRCGAPAAPAAITWSTATRRWATRSPAAWAWPWPSPVGASSSWSATART